MSQRSFLSIEAIDECQGHYIVPFRRGHRIERPEWHVTGKYRILEHLGCGMYGQVVRAQLASDLSKTVVIKRTNDLSKYGPSEAKCALREIAIMRRLDHPNVVKVLDILEPEEGSPRASDAALAGVLEPSHMFKNIYIVLEDGGVDLKSFLKEQTDALTQPQIQHISRQICASVSYLHSCRVVHRDIKPANILIQNNKKSSSYLHVRIADFGLSRAVELPPGSEIPPPFCAATIPSVSTACPLPIRKSQSEANFLARGIPESEFRTVAGEEGMHACLQMGLQSVALDDAPDDDFQTNGRVPMYSQAILALLHECNTALHSYAQMTAHVVSRPYRAPEAVLCAGNYSQVSASAVPHFVILSFDTTSLL
jgi:serine/threonine protein kinase